MGVETGNKPTRGFAEKYKPTAEPLIPEWPKAAEPKLPDLPADVPELMLPAPEPKSNFGGNLISHKNSFFLKAEDFRMISDDIDAIIRSQKKHHKLTDIKKEENAQFERMSFIIEDAQRKLMHVDRTLFE